MYILCIKSIYLIHISIRHHNQFCMFRTMLYDMVNHMLWMMLLHVMQFQGLVNVLLAHHPNIGDIISNKYLKVQNPQQIDQNISKWDIYQTLYYPL